MSLALALFIQLFTDTEDFINCHDFDTFHYYQFKYSHTNKPDYCNNNFIITTHLRKLLLISGDVECNPGPKSTFELKVIHLNARSIPKNKDLIESECNKYDIITCSETFFTPNYPVSDSLLPDFHPPVRLDRINQLGGGVAIYVKSNLYCKLRPDLNIPNLEAVWIETRIGKETLLIGSFYRPPSSAVDYWYLIRDSFGKVNSTGFKFIVLGDFNADFNLPNKHLQDIINMFDLYQLTNSDTRITETSSTKIDLIFTQSPQLVKSVEVLPEICSDHCIPCATIVNPIKTNHTFKRTVYQYEKLNDDLFCSLLSEVAWEEILSIQSIEKCAINFTNILIDIACKCMPVKITTIRSRDAIWLTNDIRHAMKIRHKLFKKAKHSNNGNDWFNYRQSRNRVTNMIRKRKSNYYAEIEEKVSDGNKFGQKDWWKLVRSFINKKGLSSNHSPLCVGNNVLYSNEDKANAFNEYFVLQSTVEDPDDDPPDVLIPSYELSDIVLSIYDIKNVINGLEKNKAVGPDKIHNILLIAAINIISEPLTRLFNRCLIEKVFPSIWKIAHVLPLHKKGSTELCSNYRPISLLSCVGKLFERCIYSYVFSYLKLNNIITPSQSGFIPGDSTINQLLVIYNDLCISFDKKITSQSVYFDISKAFDRVWHKGLIKKLEGVGIKGNLLAMFKNYLEDRKQAVSINGILSTYKYTVAGVPQGSVLGPLLFLIYINDIVYEIESVIKLFADDTNISLAEKDPLVRAKTLNSDLKKINDWSKHWKVDFNQEKTELLTFKHDNFPIYPLTFGDVSLVSHEVHKHLGLTLQINCKWDEHINHIVKKTTMLISCLRSYKYKFNRKVLETLYKSFIRPHFDYADVVWDNCTDKLSDILENLNLEAIRTIVGAVRGTSHEKLYKESGFTSLKERRKRHKLIKYHKIINDNPPELLLKLLPPLVSAVNPYHKRRPHQRVVPSFKTELYRKSFIPSTTMLWNELPDNIQCNKSISVLKRFLSQDDFVIPPYFYLGNRYIQIFHCRLRLGISNLNYDLFRRHLINDPACSCGYAAETSEHFLLYCPIYNDIRNQSINNLNVQDVSILLFGSSNLSVPENNKIFLNVQTFISLSKRFD